MPLCHGGAVYAEAAKYYDLIHDARGRDAAAEADLVVVELLRRHPQARSLLDVACGTGANLPRLAERFDVAGLDVSADMLALAAERAPNVPLISGDMREFDLGRRFDAVVCLFSGIGYLVELADLQRAVATMGRHLEPGGVLMIEGWVEPEHWLGSTVHAESARSEDVAVARVSRSNRNGQLCEISMRYTAATSDGITTLDELHVLRLSDPAEFEEAYRRAGLSFERLPHMLHPGRAVYVGTLGT